MLVPVVKILMADEWGLGSIEKGIFQKAQHTVVPQKCFVLYFSSFLFVVCKKI